MTEFEPVNDPRDVEEFWLDAGRPADDGRDVETIRADAVTRAAAITRALHPEPEIGEGIEEAFMRKEAEGEEN